MRLDGLKELERSGWDAKAHSYDLLTGRITERLAAPLLDAAAVRTGTRLLDVGSGPSHVAGLAAGRGAAVTGVDIADEMLAVARRRHPGVRFLRADAEDLPFPDGSFDALVAGMVVNHLPRTEPAVVGFARVLAPGGRIALSTWDVPARTRFIGILLDALRDCGVDAPGTATGPDPFRFSDNGEFRALLRRAGFEDVEVSSLSVTHLVADADELWNGILGGSVRTAGLVMRQAPETRARIRARVGRLAEEYRTDGGLAIPARVKIAAGRKP